jgi:hypothetical protein
MKKPFLILFKFLFLFLLSSSFQDTLHGQDSLANTRDTKKWHFKAEPYLMFPNMSGNTGIVALPLVKIDAKANDIFERLKFGGMLYLDISNDKWSFNSDFLYMDLEQQVKTGNFITGGYVSAKQIGWELAALKRVSPWFEAGIGGLLNGLEIGENISVKNLQGNITDKSATKKRTWYDPMIITRFSSTGKSKFYGQVRAEIGGFGIGSDLAWQAQAIAGYHFSKLFEMSIGYRVISLDYKHGSELDSFIYDVITYGAMVRLGFNF